MSTISLLLPHSSPRTPCATSGWDGEKGEKAAQELPLSHSSRVALAEVKLGHVNPSAVQNHLLDFPIRRNITCDSSEKIVSRLLKMKATFLWLQELIGGEKNES